MNRINLFRAGILCALSLLVLLSGCSSQKNTIHTTSGIHDSQEKTAAMTVIGDSIASGQALSRPEKQRYSTLLDEMLAQQNINCIVTNYAQNGLDSDELLDALKERQYYELSNADWVIVSIGANNLLGAAMNFFEDHISSFLPNLSDLTTADYAAFLNKLEKGITQFQKEMPQIVQEIRRQNSNCRIVLQTVYNPFGNTELSIFAQNFSMPLDKLSNDYIRRINETVWQLESQEEDILIADVFTAFAQCQQDCVNTQSGRKLFGLPIDPHPNQNGHRVIAELILPLLLL